MTYYCPTHGDLGIVKSIEETKKEINNIFLKKDRSSKDWLFKINFKNWEKVLILLENLTR